MELRNDEGACIARDRRSKPLPAHTLAPHGWPPKANGAPCWFARARQARWGCGSLLAIAKRASVAARWIARRVRGVAAGRAG